jgi:hypothetical protein
LQAALTGLESAGGDLRATSGDRPGDLAVRFGAGRARLAPGDEERAGGPESGHDRKLVERGGCRLCAGLVAELRLVERTADDPSRIVRSLKDRVAGRPVGAES